MCGIGLLGRCRPRGQGRDDVEDRGELAGEVDGAQRVEVDGGGPAGAAAQQQAEEAARAVVEGDVVGVGGDAVVVKGDEHVNVGDGLLGGLLLGEVRGKGAHEEAGDSGLVPGRGHGVGKVGAGQSEWLAIEGVGGGLEEGCGHTGYRRQKRLPRREDQGSCRS